MGYKIRSSTGAKSEKSLTATRLFPLFSALSSCFFYSHYLQIILDESKVYSGVHSEPILWLKMGYCYVCNWHQPLKPKLRLPLKAGELVFCMCPCSDRVPLFLMLPLIYTDSGLLVSTSDQSCGLAQTNWEEFCCPKLHSCSNTSLMCQRESEIEAGGGSADRSGSW